nr:MAG TPA: Lecithin retinol acyltransferase [Caudoviricetes sp.]
MLLFEKNLLEGVRLRPGDLLHITPPRVDHWISNICIYTTNSCFAYTSNQYLVYAKFSCTTCSSNIIYKSNYQKSK